MIIRLEYFYVQHTFGVRDKRKYIKNTYTGKKRKAWNKLTKPFSTNIAKFGIFVLQPREMDQQT